MRTHRSAHAKVLAEPGWTSGALTAAVLEGSPDPLIAANAISIWIGGDDLAQAGLAMMRGASPAVMEAALAQYARNIDLLVTGIRRVSQARIVLCAQYNPFPNSPVAGQGIAALNELTAKAAARHHAVLAPTNAWFAGREAELIAGYRSGRIEDALVSPHLPIHPNDRGHRVIGEHLVKFVAGR